MGPLIQNCARPVKLRDERTGERLGGRQRVAAGEVHQRLGQRVAFALEGRAGEQVTACPAAHQLRGAGPGAPRRGPERIDGHALGAAAGQPVGMERDHQVGARLPRAVDPLG